MKGRAFLQEGNEAFFGKKESRVIEAETDCHKDEKEDAQESGLERPIVSPNLR